MVICTYTPHTWEVEAGRSQVQDQPGLHSEFQANLSYIANPVLKKKKKTLHLWLMGIHLLLIFIGNKPQSWGISSASLGPTILASSLCFIS
jgi:hypothetical protein